MTSERLTLIEERVPAHDLKVGDTIIVGALTGDYVGTITAIEEYEVFQRHAWDGKLGTSPANSSCLCIRLPHLNTYRAKFDMVRRLVDV